jgi:hypothetical protein
VAITCPSCHADNPETKQFCADCGTQLRPSEAVPLRTGTLETLGHELARGTTIAGRYEVIEELGRGGAPHPKTGPAKNGVFWLLKLTSYLSANCCGVKSPAVPGRACNIDYTFVCC